MCVSTTTNSVSTEWGVWILNQLCEFWTKCESTATKVSTDHMYDMNMAAKYEYSTVTKWECWTKCLSIEPSMSTEPTLSTEPNVSTEPSVWVLKPNIWSPMSPQL